MKVLENETNVFQLTIAAEHEEKEDQHGHHVSRQMKRRFILPRLVDVDHITTTLSDDGISFD